MQELSEIHFGCKECGKCCEYPPRVNYFEMLELSDKFIWQTGHHALISYAKEPLDKKMIEHLQTIGHTIMIPEFDASMFYFIDFIALQAPSRNSCSQLIDNKCTIYGSRPSACKIAPLSFMYDEEEQWEPIKIYYENIIKKDWKCSFDKKEKMIYQKNNIVINNHSQIYHQEIMHIRNITNSYIEFLSMQGEEKKNKHFEMIFTAIKNKSMVVSDIVFALQMGIFNNFISYQYANNVISNQIKLIEKEIEYSTIKKEKSDLENSRNLKKIKESYLEILKKELFKQNQDEIYLSF